MIKVVLVPYWGTVTVCNMTGPNLCCLAGLVETGGGSNRDGEAKESGMDASSDCK